MRHGYEGPLPSSDAGRDQVPNLRNGFWGIFLESSIHVAAEKYIHISTNCYEESLPEYGIQG
eukprot:4688234-Amphidinium_carterae.1